MNPFSAAPRSPCSGLALGNADPMKMSTNDYKK